MVVQKIMIVGLVVVSIVSAQPRNTIELSYNRHVAARISHDWGYRLKTTVTFVGDVDGDGLDDFMCYRTERTEPTRHSALIILYGASEQQLKARGDELRQVDIILPEDHGVFSAPS